MKILRFTGERMIPDINKGKELYFEHLDRYRYASQFVKGKNVLDLACGTGYGTKMLSDAGASKVNGVDISSKAINYAKQRYGSKNVKFDVGNALDIKPTDKKFDIIICFEFIEHIREQKQLLEVIKDSLADSGILIISTPNKLNYKDKNVYHVKELVPADFRDMLKRHFKFVETLGQFFWFADFIGAKPGVQKATGEFGPFRNEDALYIIAVCSDKKIVLPALTFVASGEVDGINISKGMHPLFDLIGTASKLQAELNKITSSKTYKVWQFYCRIRDGIFK